MLLSDSCFPILLCFLISSVLFSDSGCVILSGFFCETSTSLVFKLVFLFLTVVFRYPLRSGVLSGFVCAFRLLGFRPEILGVLGLGLKCLCCEGLVLSV